MKLGPLNVKMGDICLCNTVHAYIVMNNWGVGPLRPVPLDPLILSIFDLVSPSQGVRSDDTEKQSSILRTCCIHFRSWMSSTVWYLYLFTNVCVSLTSLVKPESGLRNLFCAPSNFPYTFYFKSKLWNHISVLPSIWRFWGVVLFL